MFRFKDNPVRADRGLVCPRGLCTGSEWTGRTGRRGKDHICGLCNPCGKMRTQLHIQGHDGRLHPDRF